jgi:hypothetical protein
MIVLETEPVLMVDVLVKMASLENIVIKKLV